LKNMRIRTVTVSISLCLCLASVLLAQDKAADPLSGIWFGYYGTSPRDQAQVRVTLEWDGKALRGEVTTGDEPYDIERATFDPKTGTIHLEVETPGRGRGSYHYIIDGKVEKDTITGLWHHESARGDFQIKKIS
jgi:hypothetical protein